ncbi:hypothetical protein SANTM175S_06298 [Streptomyces antimycoticus]
MTPQNQQDRVDRSGLLYGFAAYAFWGLVPLFWPLLEPAGAVEILAHRMVGRWRPSVWYCWRCAAGAGYGRCCGSPGGWA